jgi:hypothetical protein
MSTMMGGKVPGAKSPFVGEPNFDETDLSENSQRMYSLTEGYPWLPPSARQKAANLPGKWYVMNQAATVPGQANNAATYTTIGEAKSAAARLQQSGVSPAQVLVSWEPDVIATLKGNDTPRVLYQKFNELFPETGTLVKQAMAQDPTYTGWYDLLADAPDLFPEAVGASAPQGISPELYSRIQEVARQHGWSGPQPYTGYVLPGQQTPSAPMAPSPYSGDINDLVRRLSGGQ